MIKPKDHSVMLGKVIHTLVLSLAFMIPLYKKAVPGLIALTGLALILRLLLEKRTPARWPGWPLFFLFLLYVLHAAGLAYSENPASGMNELAIKLSLLVFPMFMMFLPQISAVQTRHLERSFIAGTVCFGVLAMVVGGMHWYSTGDASFMSYDKLSIYFHPSYIATYVAFSLYFLLRDETSNLAVGGKKWLHSTLVLFLLAFGAMLASKAGLVAVVVVLMYHTTVHWKRSGLYVRKLVLPVFRLLFFAAMIYANPTTLARVAAAAGNTTDSTAPEAELPGARSSTDLRKVVWSTSWDVWKREPWGTGDASQVLSAAYRERGEEYAAWRELNAHNQWLQYGVELGWPGALIFTAALWTMLWAAWKKRSYEGILIVLLLGMNCLFESFFEVQAGVVFACFWMWIYSAERPRFSPQRTTPETGKRVDTKRDRM
jgi:O-antigen ligase